MSPFTWSSTGINVVDAFPASVINKTIVITGPSKGGIGGETAISLAHGKPSHILLLGRSEHKLTPVIEEIKEINSSIKVTFVQIDLGSQASVRRAAAAIKDVVDRIDILINNAAIMACPYAKTEDGIESQFATNYLGHFLLTNLLMEKLIAVGKGARIVNLTSTANAIGLVTFDDINFDDGKTYVPIAGYGRSKMAIVLFTKSLSKIFDSKKVAALSVHPGSISTGLQMHFQDRAVFQEMVAYVSSKIEGGKISLEEKKTLQQGCSTTLVAALDPSIEAFSGSYLADGAVAETQPDPEALNPGIAEKLWSLSESLVGEEFVW